jgi:exodeoxyribonuclease-3
MNSFKITPHPTLSPQKGRGDHDIVSSQFKIATWNVNSIKIRLPQILDWLSQTQPDILALQETKTIDENFPRAEIEAMGYQVIFAGQKAFNGMAIISRKKAENIITDIPKFDDPQRRILAATIDNIRVINLYVPNGESLLSEKYSYKLNWLNQIKKYIQDEISSQQDVVVLGDFNIAPEDRDVYDPNFWREKVLCSESERTAFQQLLTVGLKDSFRIFEQASGNFTWWDYRMAAFRRNLGLRIDHILVNESLSKQCTSCTIDKSPRKHERPSDHTPVVLELLKNRDVRI